MYHLRVEVGINVLELLGFLNGKSIPARIFVCNDKYPDVSFPLLGATLTTFNSLFISVNVPSVLMIPPTALMRRDMIVVLHTTGIIVLKVPAQSLIGDVYDAIHQVADFDDTSVVLVDVMGCRLLKNDHAMDCVFAVSHEMKMQRNYPSCEQLSVKRDEMSISFTGSPDHLKAFVRMLDDMAVIELIQCLGWHLVEPVCASTYHESNVMQLLITKAPCRLAIMTCDLQHLLVSAVFRSLIQRHEEEVRLERVLIRIKCLDGLEIPFLLNHDTALEVIAQYWKQSAVLFDWPADIRLVVHGKMIDPSCTVGSFLWAVSDRSRGFAVHLVMPSHGGGGASKGSANHNETHIPVKNATAGLLLSMGCDLNLTGTFVDKMMSACLP